MNPIHLTYQWGEPSPHGGTPGYAQKPVKQPAVCIAKSPGQPSLGPRSASCHPSQPSISPEHKQWWKQWQYVWGSTQFLLRQTQTLLEATGEAQANSPEKPRRLQTHGTLFWQLVIFATSFLLQQKLLLNLFPGFSDSGILTPCPLIDGHSLACVVLINSTAIIFK